MNLERIRLVLVGIMSFVAVASVAGANKNDIDGYIKNNTRVVIMFTKPSCPYCRYLQPLFNQLQRGVTDIFFKTVDISRSSAFKTQYRFSTVPTVIYFKDGKEVARHGSNNRTMTVTHMRSYLNKIK